MRPIINDKNAQECTVWQIPVVGQTSTIKNHMNTSKALSDEVSEQLRQQAYEEGKQQGLQAAQTEIDAIIARLDHCMGLLKGPLTLIDESIEKQLYEAISSVVKHIIHQEISLNPDLIIKLVEEAKEALPANSTHYKLFLNADDCKTLKESLSNSNNVQMEEDTTLSRGEFRLASESGEIDASINSRIHKIVEQLYEQHNESK